MKYTLASLWNLAPVMEDDRESMAMRVAAEYAGLPLEHLAFDRLALTSDALGTFYELEFRDLSLAAAPCGMCYTCYVDAFSGEVAGFFAAPGGVAVTGCAPAE